LTQIHRAEDHYLSAWRQQTRLKEIHRRIKTLEKHLTEVPEGGAATIQSDEFFNVDDKTGPEMSDYKP